MSKYPQPPSLLYHPGIHSTNAHVVRKIVPTCPAIGGVIPRQAGSAICSSLREWVNLRTKRRHGPIQSRLHRTECEDKPSGDGRSDAHGSCSVRIWGSYASLAPHLIDACLCIMGHTFMAFILNWLQKSLLFLVAVTLFETKPALFLARPWTAGMNSRSHKRALHSSEFDVNERGRYKDLW